MTGSVGTTAENVWTVDVRTVAGWSPWTEYVNRATAEAERLFAIEECGYDRADVRVRRAASLGEAL